MVNTQKIQKKLETLREKWKTASQSDRKIIEIRAKLLKKSL